MAGKPESEALRGHERDEVVVATKFLPRTREEEREMVPYCREENIALTPYSALAGGRLSKQKGETSKRLEEDGYAKEKYSAAQEQDQKIIERAAELAEAKGVSAIRAPQAGRGHGSEHACRIQNRACVVYREPENLKRR